MPRTTTSTSSASISGRLRFFRAVFLVYWVTSQILQIACKSDRRFLDLGAWRMAIASEMRCVGFAPTLIESTQDLQSFNVNISGRWQPCVGGCSGCSALQAAARDVSILGFKAKQGARWNWQCCVKATEPSELELDNTTCMSIDHESEAMVISLVFTGDE